MDGARGDISQHEELKLIELILIEKKNGPTKCKYFNWINKEEKDLFPENFISRSTHHKVR